MAEQHTLPVRGMHCAACVGKVERALATVPGGADQLRHPDLTRGQALRYAAPRGRERSVWIARRRHPDPIP